MDPFPELFYEDPAEQPAEEEEGDEAAFPETLATAIRDEVAQVISVADQRGVRLCEAEGAYGCPFCPLRTFEQKRELKTHLKTQHQEPEQAPPSASSSWDLAVRHGTESPKLRGIAWHLYDEDRIREGLFSMGLSTKPPEGARYLEQAASVLLAQVQDSPSWHGKEEELAKLTRWDKKIRLLLEGNAADGEQPRYVLTEDYEALGKHRIGRFRATDAYLAGILGELLHTETRAARGRIMAMRQGPSLARSPEYFMTLCEEVMGSAVVCSAFEAARAAADVSILAVDGQWSTSKSILYQRQHGSGGHPDPEDQLVVMTVTCRSGLLLATPQSGEDAKAALEKAVPAGRANEVRLVYSDSPERDDPDVAELYPHATTAQDPLHIALRIEKGMGGHTTKMSALLRRILQKFRLPAGEHSPGVYRKGDYVHSKAKHLQRHMDNMTAWEAGIRVGQMELKEYIDAPYTSHREWSRDLAAIAKAYPEQLRRRTHKGTTVKASLANSTREVIWRYLCNGPAMILAAGLTGDLPYGTTTNEANHLELVHFFRNVLYQTKRRQSLALAVWTLRKCIVMQVGNRFAASNVPPGEVLNRAAREVMLNPPNFPAIDVDNRRNPPKPEDLAEGALDRAARNPRSQPEAPPGR